MDQGVNLHFSRSVYMGTILVKWQNFMSRYKNDKLWRLMTNASEYIQPNRYLSWSFFCFKNRLWDLQMSFKKWQIQGHWQNLLVITLFLSIKFAAWLNAILKGWLWWCQTISAVKACCTKATEIGAYFALQYDLLCDLIAWRASADSVAPLRRTENQAKVKNELPVW